MLFQAAANQSGVAVITVIVTDGGLDGNLATSNDNASVMQAFAITATVTPLNYPPTLDPISNPKPVWHGDGEQALALTGISAGGGETQPLAVSVTSSNPAVLSSLVVDYASPQAGGVLRYTPTSTTAGRTQIRVIVTDGGRDGSLATPEDNSSISRSFTITVLAQWQNSTTPADVDHNGKVEPLDALVLINYLNANGAGALPLPPPPGGPPLFVDVNGDDEATALDVLLVINRLNLAGTLDLLAADVATAAGLGLR